MGDKSRVVAVPANIQLLAKSAEVSKKLAAVPLCVGPSVSILSAKVPLVGKGLYKRTGYLSPKRLRPWSHADCLTCSPARRRSVSTSTSYNLFGGQAGSKDFAKMQLTNPGLKSCLVV